MNNYSVLGYCFGENDPMPSYMARIEGKVWIYGIFTNVGECLYIGQTVHFFKRRTYHMTQSKSQFKDYREKIIMLPIRLVKAEDSNKIERETQLAMNPRLSNRHWKVYKPKG